MSKLSDIVGPKRKDMRSIIYQIFLYSFSSQTFYEKVEELEEYFEVPIFEIVKDDLFKFRILEERGIYTMTSHIRSKIIDYLIEYPMEFPEFKIKNQGMKNRQIAGLKSLKEYGEKNNYCIICYMEGEALLMWDFRTKGILVRCGSSWAYVYKTGLSRDTDTHFPLLGYFQLAGNNVTGMLQKAINRKLKDRADALSERRKDFVMRQKARWQNYNEKKNASQNSGPGNTK